MGLATWKRLALEIIAKHMEVYPKMGDFSQHLVLKFTQNFVTLNLTLQLFKGTLW